MDDELRSSPVTTPYVMVFEQQFFVVAERQIIVEVNSFAKAMSALFACYYTFDIAYPKQCLNSFLFLERFMYGIVTGPKLSKTVVGVISDIQKINYFSLSNYFSLVLYAFVFFFLYMFIFSFFLPLVSCIIVITTSLLFIATPLHVTI